MTVEIERDALLGALQQVNGVIEARNTIPVLSNVLFVVADGTLTVTGTDLDIEANATAPAIGEIKTTLPSDKILAAAKSFKPGRLTIAEIEGRSAVVIKQGRSTRTIPTLSADTFPIRAGIKDPVIFRIAGECLVRVLGSCRIAQSSEETRYYLCGVFMHVAEGRLRCVATDGFRLVRADVDLPDNADKMPDIILPSKAVAQVLQLLTKSSGDVEIVVNKDAIQFRLGTSRIVSKLVDGTYPDYSRTIPAAGSHVLKVGRDQFVGPITSAAAIVNAEGDKNKSRSVAFDFGAGDDAYEVSAKDHAGNSATEPIEASFEGGSIRFGLNSQYARDLAGVFADGSTLTISLESNSSPLRFSSDKDPDLLGVCMPMRV